MDFGLSGNAVAVTGSSHGIRKAITCDLVEEDAKISIYARNEERLGKAAKEITNLPAFLASEGADYVTGDLIQVDRVLTKPMI